MAKRNIRAFEPAESLTPEVPVETPEVEEAAKDETPVVTGKIVNCERLRIRKNPNVLEDNIIKVLSKNTEVTILDNSNAEWTKVQVDDIIGYAMAEFITTIK